MCIDQGLIKMLIKLTILGTYRSFLSWKFFCRKQSVGEKLFVTPDNFPVQAADVKFVVTDETNTDWSKSRRMLNLPHSSTVSHLYYSVSSEAGTLLVLHIFYLSFVGYAFDTFDLVWRCQNSSHGEQEVILDRLSVKTLSEVGMLDASKQIYLLIRGRDDTTDKVIIF